MQCVARSLVLSEESEHTSVFHTSQLCKISIFLIIIYFTILYWFCHTSTCIRHGCTCVPHFHFCIRLKWGKTSGYILSTLGSPHPDHGPVPASLDDVVQGPPPTHLQHDFFQLELFLHDFI